MHTSPKHCVGTLAVLVMMFGAGPLVAQEATNYPVRPIRMIVPFAPGGASDFVGRIIQPAMSELLNQQIVIDNRGDADGNIGVEVAARATPDGYHILLGNVGTMAINPNFFTKFPIKPVRDLVSIIQVVDVPGSLVTHPSLAVKSAKELAEYLKANPNKLNYGAPAASSANRLDMESFLAKTGTRAVTVVYKGGAGPATIGLLGNEVQMMFVTLSSAVSFVKQGRLRMLGVIAPERVAVVPDVPTMREQGYEMVVGSWQGVFAPKGTPRGVVNKLFGITQAAMKNPDVIRRLSEGGVSIVASKSPEDFAAFVKKENERYAEVIRVANIPTE